MRAFRLINVNGTDSAFEEGEVPEFRKIAATHFFNQSQIEQYEISVHPAPRRQYVVTLKGKLKFTVTNGNSFIIEPGILLIAEDILGQGHTWELIEGKTWERVYIVLPPDGDDHFVKKII